ncbi:Mog1p/PsbP-like protein [Aspergillus sclerotioniger CBS 115572]|uniref:Mog1p/PsbP-like protein n=1 Tax=Aspergillus sclerotioniger CBS 115572 TaxID=1450535 RepID=A0A317X702_9EURO|nr:Mog1p/PsbP-like protein [Aspergillus sclerotioniger CBS 115572]PWY94394.1 Mog1p/PsbP-like protein [Aspergillus sclerotioniger CBS 115572]
MTTTYTPQPLYGGAIKALIPNNWIDASTLRQIPDHQELYLSPTTLSTLIYEINEYVPTSTSLTTLTNYTHLLPPSQAQSQSHNQEKQRGQESLDRAAVIYHLHDLLDEGDELDMIIPPTRVTVGKGFEEKGKGRRYTGCAVFKSTSKWKETTTKCWFLVVRLEEQETDLVVWGNVPGGELSGEELRMEEEGMGALVGALGRELKVVEWDLFG